MVSEFDFFGWQNIGWGQLPPPLPHVPTVMFMLHYNRTCSWNTDQIRNVNLFYLFK